MNRVYVRGAQRVCVDIKLLNKNAHSVAVSPTEIEF